MKEKKNRLVKHNRWNKRNLVVRGGKKGNEIRWTATEMIVDRDQQHTRAHTRTECHVSATDEHPATYHFNENTSLKTQFNKFRGR